MAMRECVWISQTSPNFMISHDPENLLTSSVLVLNRFYMPVRVVSVRRAFILLFREVAEVIKLEDGHYANYDFCSWCEMSELWLELAEGELEPESDWIRSVNRAIQVPRVIRLTEFDQMVRESMRFSRRTLFARDGNSCQYCGKTLASNQLSMDHVIPKSQGGETTWENIVCCCMSCNSRKGGRTPQQARMKLKRQPQRPKQNPIMMAKLKNPKYASWECFLPKE